MRQYFELAYASTVSASRRGCTIFSQIPASTANLAKSERFLHALGSRRKAGRGFAERLLILGALEKIDGGFGRRIDANGHAFNGVVFNSLIEHFGSEAHDLNAWLRNLWTPFTGPDRDPDERRNAIRKFVKGERGIVTDDTIGYELRSHGQRMVSVKRGVGQLVESATELIEETLLLHA